HPRYLHSFPTRRSSDLMHPQKPVGIRTIAPPPARARYHHLLMELEMELEVYHTVRLAVPPTVCRTVRLTVESLSAKVFRVTRRRSEEHTSELQSRENLV